MKFKKGQRIRVKDSSPLRKLSKMIAGKSGFIKRPIGFNKNTYSVSLDNIGVVIVFAQELESAE